MVQYPTLVERDNVINIDCVFVDHKTNCLLTDKTFSLLCSVQFSNKRLVFIRLESRKIKIRHYLYLHFKKTYKQFING